MKARFSFVLLAAATWVAAVGVGGAAEAVRQPRVEVNRGGVHVDVEAKGQATARAVRVRDMIGIRVYNSSNEDLGKIEDLVMDPSAGKVRYAVLSFGGVLGLGDKLFAVPWESLQLVPKGTTGAGTVKEDYYLLNISKASLKNAPGFDKNHWPDFADRNWSSDVERFYSTARRPTGTQTR